MTTFYRRLPRFECVQPATLDEALSLLGRYGSDAKPLAGGTDLIPQLKRRQMAVPRVLLDLKGVPGLNTIVYDTKQGLTIGATSSITNLERSPLVRQHYPMLSCALSTIASPQIRNRATMIGNICSAVPSADSAPTLLVLEAVLKVVNQNGERFVPITQFFTAPRQTVLGNDELIT
jgi:CO/xanthine dehydrogenase FAD-binding subunit